MSPMRRNRKTKHTNAEVRSEGGVRDGGGPQQFSGHEHMRRDDPPTPKAPAKGQVVPT
jgi:hypothetical protein